MSLEEALKQKRDRRAALLAAPPVPEPSFAPEPDFKPAPMPIVDAPTDFASAFWRKRTPEDDPSKPKPKSKKPRPGRRPVGDLPRAAVDRFTVVDGGTHGGDNDPPRGVQ